MITPDLEVIGFLTTYGVPVIAIECRDTVPHLNNIICLSFARSLLDIIKQQIDQVIDIDMVKNSSTINLNIILERFYEIGGRKFLRKL